MLRKIRQWFILFGGLEKLNGERRNDKKGTLYPIFMFGLLVGIYKWGMSISIPLKREHSVIIRWNPVWHLEIK
ncbi:MAG: hypothetical protein WC783_00570 [Candidatus Paceibacterota bacterium]|jgi:hypothetical protein